MIYRYILNLGDFEKQDDGKFKITQPLQTYHFGNVLHKVSIDEITIPFTFYTVVTGRNVLSVASSPSGSGTITIDPGSYNIAELKVELENKLQALDSDFTVSYSGITNKFTLANSSGNFSINYDNTTASRLLGTYGESGTTTPATSLTFPHQFDLYNGNARLYLCMSNKKVNSVLVTGNQRSNEIVLTIPTLEFDENKTFRFSDNLNYYFTMDPSFHGAYIYIVNEYGDIVDFDSQNIVIQLTFSKC